jgi:hypothetical protein
VRRVGVAVRGAVAGELRDGCSSARQSLVGVWLDTDGRAPAREVREELMGDAW